MIQISLLDEVINGDIAGIATKLEQLSTAAADPEQHRPKRMPLPSKLART